MAKRPKGRQPKRSKQQGPPSAAAPAAAEDAALSWRFSTLDRAYPQEGGWAAVDEADLRRIVDRIAALDDRPPMEVVAGPATSQRHFTVYDQSTIDRGFTADAKRQLARRERDDATEIARIRIGSAKRLYAVRTRRGVFEMLWWDPNHEIYPTEPRNT